MAKTAPVPLFIKRPRLRALLGGISDQKLDELVQAGAMPKPVLFGPRSIMFPADEVDAAIAAMRAAR